MGKFITINFNYIFGATIANKAVAKRNSKQWIGNGTNNGIAKERLSS